jgi:phenylacetate-CoA ligase
LGETALLCRRLFRQQYLADEQLRALQAARLQRLPASAEAHVPFWRERLKAAGMTAADLRQPGDLRHLPPVTKAELQAAGEEARTSRGFPPTQLDRTLTSGSSGRPFVIVRDPHVRRVRQATFLRTLWAGGYRPGMSMLLVSSRPKTKRAGWLRWHHASSEDPPETVLELFQAVRPDILYGFTTPLRQLASLCTRLVRPHRPKAVFTTAETLDEPTRRLLEGSFGTTPFDIYGSTECGTLGYQCSSREGYHLAEDLVITEFLPSAVTGMMRLVTTPLDLLGMPLFRYDIGDVVDPGPLPSCACGRRFARVRRFEGRLVDCVRRADGSLLAPFHLTLAIEPIEGIARYQIIQEAIDRFVVRIEPHGPHDPMLERKVEAAMQRVLGDSAGVATRFEERLEPPPGQKFRVVESRLGQPPVAT